jgi:flagellin
LRIGTNISAMFAYRQYNQWNKRMAQAAMRLSSGLRINSAADDPAGLAISEKMRAQIRGLAVASRNCEDAISVVQIAEGAMSETHSILQRMRELAMQAASDTNDDSIDRAALDAEYQQLLQELGDISGQTQFNGRPLLDGSAEGSNGLIIQTGPNSGDTLKISIGRVTPDQLGISGTGIATRDAASGVLDQLDGAIKTVSTHRANLGAIQNRLEHKINNLDTQAENLSAAESRIRDADMALEMMEYTKASIMAQAAAAMMAQANNAPKTVLTLLQSL